MVSALPRNKAIEEARPVGTKLTPEEIRRIHGLIEAGMYISVSDFVREAIRDKLRDVKVIK
jgi:Arc/MetJ-type ribon-helix-helix transcriptional regulator